MQTVHAALESSLLAALTAILEEEGLSHDALALETPLKALDLTSMQFLRVVGALEEQVGLPLDAGLSQVETVGDLVRELVALKEVSGVGGPA